MEFEPTTTIADLAQAYALDSVLYCHTFFPKTFRERSAPFHKELLQDLDNPVNREVAFEVFRGGAKTTLLRVFASKRIAYGISRTIMYVSASQNHSLNSVRWVRRQIETNKAWADFYGLQKGKKWTDEHLEIYHSTFDFYITILAVGITGQTRGINIDDHRPDLIVVDDADDEETTGTPEQRAKTEARFFGAISKSLTPRSENPEAKIVVLATSLHKEDLVNKCHADPTWLTRKYPILDENNESRWPLRHPTEEVLRDKDAHIARGQILLWLREMECTIGDEETADFKGDWLQFWEILPDKMIIILSCDPAPPPTDAQLKKGLKGKDEEVWSVQGLFNGRYYLLEQRAERDHDAEWSVNTFFSLCEKWRPIKVVIESIAYQKTLQSFLEREMRQRKRYFAIEEFKDRRKKRHRILQAFSGIASQGNLLVHREHQGFISQFSAYPNVDHDDRLDAAAIGFEKLTELIELDDFGELDDAMGGNELDWRRPAP